MQGFQAATAAVLIRALPIADREGRPRPLPRGEREADKAMLDRASISIVRAAFIVSLWPPAGQCLIRAAYTASLPAEFGARALQRRIANAFGAKFAEASPPARLKLRRAA
jgi:hypothetical protein